MSASFDAVDDKLREADFFLTKMEETGLDVRAWRFYFSAFVTAARSVTFVLQTVMSDVPGFAEWYANRQDRLRADTPSRYFTSVRNEVQKRGTNPVAVWGRNEDGGVDAFFVHWYGDPEAVPPATDVATACKEQMRTLACLVFEVYRDFGHFIDPAIVYTAEGAKCQGLTIEDVEEQLIGVRGWTAGLPLDERFRLLRRNEPMPSVDDLFVKYLNHDRFAVTGHRETGDHA
ncbi:MAG: hypothetical protein IMZ69_06595 [Spirochaetes bacterium]|nr:hypothetical protein [Spirochaetota bacterium]